MRLRVELSAPPALPQVAEHDGPEIRIGRSPGCDLVLAGESALTASWEHARVELSPSGAFVADTGSSNGTFLNDQRLRARAQLRVGDNITFGRGGPILRVLAIDTSPAKEPLRRVPHRAEQPP